MTIKDIVANARVDVKISLKSLFKHVAIIAMTGGAKDNEQERDNTRNQ